MKKFILFILVLFTGSTLFYSNSYSQWIKQNWPVFETIYGISFFDANTGLVAMKTFPESQHNIYRTTNAGFNWNFNYRTRIIKKTQKVDSSSFFFLGLDFGAYGGNDKIYKSFNNGETWDSLDFGLFAGLTNFYFISKDTGWISKFTGSSTNIYKTDNGGISLSLTYSIPSGSDIPVLFFLKQKYNGNYIGFRSFLGTVKKTTDGGYTWIDLPGLPTMDNLDTPPDIRQITFINKDTGWVTNGTNKIFKTINGGYNWISQTVYNNTFYSYSFWYFRILNKDTIFSDGGSFKLWNNTYRGIVLVTTNSGVNWGYQIPDTLTQPYEGFGHPEFVNSNTGWFSNLHTTNGGGPIIFTEIKHISVEHPEKYQLFQNFPNPFNPSTTIEFYLPQNAYVNLSIFDISGKRIYTVINNFHLVGGYHSYRIDAFETLGLPSGMYFYSLAVTEKL